MRGGGLFSMRCVSLRVDGPFCHAAPCVAASLTDWRAEHPRIGQNGLVARELMAGAPLQVYQTARECGN